MSWIRRIFHRRELYNDLAAEMRAHLDEKTEQFVREGMSREEAEHAARRAFGNATLIEELKGHAAALGDVWTPLVEELSRRIDAHAWIRCGEHA